MAEDKGASVAGTEGQVGLVKLMAGVVVLTAGLVALSLLATNPREETAIGAIARAPASLVGMALTPAAPVALLERTSVLDLDCNAPEVATVTGDVRQLRVRGRLCNTGQDITETEVVNLTNGFTATVFTPNTGLFTTDYIHLAEGENRLRVTHVLASGERQIQEFAIHRL